MTTTTRRGTSRTIKAAAAGMAGLAILTAGLSGCASTQASAQVAVEDKQAGGWFKMAEWLGEEVAGVGVHEGVVGLMEALFGGEEAEDPNKERFDQVSEQLEGVHEQLDAMQESMSTLISKTDKAGLASAMTALSSDGADVADLYNKYFMPITDANQKLVADVAAGADTATLDADRKAVATATNDFRVQYATNSALYGPLDNKIHGFLIPTAQHSVLAAEGAVLMDKGYINSADSVQLRAMYDMWANYEAMAALMSGTYSYLGGADPATHDQAWRDKTATTTLEDWHKRRDIEVEDLPPMVPAGHIVTTPNGTLEGAVEFVPSMHTDDQSQPSVAVDPVPRQLADTPTAELRNPAEVYQWGNWKIPSNATLKKLTDSVVKAQGATVADKLADAAARVAPNTASTWHTAWLAAATTGYIWTSSSSASNEVLCGNGGSRFMAPPLGTFRTFQLWNAANVTGSDAVYTTNPAALPTLRKPGEQGWVNDGACLPAVNTAVAAAKGGLVLSLPVTNNYMAQE